MVTVKQALALLSICAEKDLGINLDWHVEQFIGYQVFIGSHPRKYSNYVMFRTGLPADYELDISLPDLDLMIDLLGYAEAWVQLVKTHDEISGDESSEPIWIRPERYR